MKNFNMTKTAHGKTRQTPFPRKHPRGDEAFADLFIEVSSNGKNRLGNYPEAIELIKNVNGYRF